MENIKEFKSKKEVSEYLLTEGIDTANWTELDWLKLNKGQADIHMMFLAEVIYDAKNESTPKQLKEGEWHIPYGDNIDKKKVLEFSQNHKEITKNVEDNILKIAIVRCARVSYHIAGQEQVIDYEADLKLYDRLATSGHWSPFEHVAKVMTDDEYYKYHNGKLDIPSYQEKHFNDNNSWGWCRNYRGFIQQRALMD